MPVHLNIDKRNEDIQIYINGTFHKKDEAKISVFDSGFLLGDGIWEGIRLYKNKWLFLDDHLDRLIEGCKAIDINTELSKDDIKFLNKVNENHIHLKDADTYSQNIMDRLLIDLSWNSSRLEGNTYSLLDTKRLIAFGEKASGRSLLEAQMILNHKEAISFLIRNEHDIGINRYTFLNVHALLSQNLLLDPSATGRLRRIPVGIERSTFIPLETPQRIEDNFDLILKKAADIQDPFETAFFLMVHIPYLQPFDDVNKRMSRVVANMPLFENNVSPLSFTDVPKDAYIASILCVYECNDIHLLKDLFLWAYKRSAQRYAAIKQSIGDPDPFRVKYYQAMRDIIMQIITNIFNIFLIIIRTRFRTS